MKALLPFRTAFSHVNIHPFSVFLATRLEIRARFLYNMLGHAGLSKEEKTILWKGCRYTSATNSHMASHQRKENNTGDPGTTVSATLMWQSANLPQIWLTWGRFLKSGRMKGEKQKQIHVSEGKRQIFFSRVGGAWREWPSSLERMGISWRRKLQAHHKQREKSKRQETKDWTITVLLKIRNGWAKPGDKDEEIHNWKKKTKDTIMEGFTDCAKMLRSLDLILLCGCWFEFYIEIF